MTDDPTNTVAWTDYLRIACLTFIVWFGPSVLVLQRVRSWQELRDLGWMLPVFPGLMTCHFAGSVFGRLADAGSVLAGTLTMLALLGGTLALAYRCYNRSSEWLPLLGAFFLSSLLWWMASAMLAA
jgi:hypothetical protein